MTSHELAKFLLENPDLLVATCAYDQVFMSEPDSKTQNSLKIGILETSNRQYIIIGDMSRKNLIGDDGISKKNS